MPKTVINIDRDVLAQAQRILGTGTIRATVDRALREVVRRHAAEEFLALADAGVFDEPPAEAAR